MCKYMFTLEVIVALLTVKTARAASGPWFIFVWMCHYCTTFQNCPRDGHVAAFFTLKYRIYCKVMIRGVS